MMTPADLNKMETDEEEVSIEIVNPEAVSVETEDGGMVIDFTGEQVEEIIGGDFDRNLFNQTDNQEVNGQRVMSRDLIFLE